jgi:glucose/arabinose dehydrogenase
MRDSRVRITMLVALLLIGLLYLFPRIYPRRAVVSALEPATAYALGLLEPTWDGADVARPRHTIRLEPVLHGLESPTDLQFPPGRSDHAVVLQKDGEAVWADLTTGTSGPFFDVPVESRSELGLLGLAFHPDFASNGRFFVYLSPVDAPLRTRVEAWTSTPGAPLADAKPKFERVVLEIPQPYSNHDGGQLVFGPDGMLYVAVGDGGSGNDPQDNGQNVKTLLGAVLRLDVGQVPYGVPADNPFAGRPDLGLPELFAWGLRNPWRMSFDPTGRLVAGDVGQNAWEEITFVPRGGNLGWRRMEGPVCHIPKDCDPSAYVPPIWSYARHDGVSVTGGHVIGAGPLTGWYVFGDFASGRLWAMVLPAGPSEPAVHALGRWPVSPSAFGRGADGVVYLVCYRTGAVYRVVA